ncbi:MAG TPA: hypothetical protein VFO86_00125, partial [Terriglobia bacterium]|nr:hypothetical protein [Terriglobia bacterium]
PENEVAHDVYPLCKYVSKKDAPPSMLEEYAGSAELVESVGDWEAKEAEDQAMEVAEAEMGWDQGAWDQDRGPDQAVDIAS